jgi:hypothetical protein
MIPKASASPAEMQEIPVNSIGTGDKSDATLVKIPVSTASETGIASNPADTKTIADIIAVKNSRNTITETIK